MERTVPFLNGCISFVAFVTALTLVVYMLVVIVTGTFDVASNIFEMFFLESKERQSLFNALNAEFLHNIAVLLILMKAYRILVEYMRFHHIDIKFMVEIAIIASVLELLFNFASYSIEMRYILVALAVFFLGIYVFGYKAIKQASKDAQSIKK
ncbi:phosphate-starvation-inducible PsiE family protein [Candidatus Pacebacteria bacterium]|nr:phosphate-starvation-inducible PsiE family protein [Candidatus Paceibacterota bacterium]